VTDADVNCKSERKEGLFSYTIFRIKLG